EVGEHIDLDTLTRRLGIVPAHRKLVGRLLEILAAGGLLQAEATGWRVVRPFEPVDVEASREALLERYPQGRVELTLLGRCGGQLAGVLTGKVDALGLLFAEEGLGAGDLYESAPAAQVFNGLVRESVRQAVTALPAARRLRVL